MQWCPLFGRCPLLGVSVNRESTVVSERSERTTCIILILHLSVCLSVCDVRAGAHGKLFDATRANYTLSRKILTI